MPHMQDTKKVNQDKSKKSRESSKKKMETVYGEVIKKLETIAQKLEVGLTEISEKFTTFDEPIEEAAEKISKTFANFDKRTDSLARELQTEFTTQNTENVAKLDKLCSHLETYSNRLTAANELQTGRSETLSENVSILSGLINLLSKSINTLENVLQPKEKGEKRITRLTNESILEFSLQYKNINKNLGILFKNLKTVMSHVASHIKTQTGISRDLKKGIGHLDAHIYSMKAAFDKTEKAMELIIKTEKEKVDQAKEFAKFSSKIDAWMGQLLEGFKNLGNQNDVLIKEIKTMNNYLKSAPKQK